MAGCALLQLGERHFLLASHGRFLERDLHVVTQILAALRRRRIRPAAAKEIVKNISAAAEHFAEDIKRIVETATTASGTCSARMATKSALAPTAMP